VHYLTISGLLVQMFLTLQHQERNLNFAKKFICISYDTLNTDYALNVIYFLTFMNVSYSFRVGV